MPGSFTILHEVTYFSSLKFVLSPFKEKYMLFMDSTSIRGEYFLYHAKKEAWKLLHACIDAHSQILIDEYPGYGVHSISRLQSQCKKLIILTKSDMIDCFSK